MKTGAVLKEIAAATALLASYPLDRIARNAPAIACAAPEEPVILIHGYGGGRSNLLALASYLRLCGLDNISYFEYPRSQTITASATKLSAMVDEVAGPTGGAHLVGHSLGGSIARLYSLSARRGAVRSIVTLGSPYLFGQWAQRELAIFGDEDPIVPAPTGIIAQSMPFGRRIVLEGAGHLVLAFLPEALRLVATELRANRVSN